MSYQQPIQIAVSITRQDAYEFIKSMARDDEFRERLAANPRAVLAENGIWFSPPEEDAVPESVVLPPKPEVEGLLEEMGEPDADTGRVRFDGLGRACYVILFSFGFSAMPFIVPDGA